MSRDDKQLLAGVALVGMGLVACGLHVPFGGFVVLAGLFLIWWTL